LKKEYTLRKQKDGFVLKFSDDVLERLKKYNYNVTSLVLSKLLSDIKKYKGDVYLDHEQKRILDERMYESDEFIRKIKNRDYIIWCVFVNGLIKSGVICLDDSLDAVERFFELLYDRE